VLTPQYIYISKESRNAGAAYFVKRRVKMTSRGGAKSSLQKRDK